MAQITIWTNSNPISVPVTLGNGRSMAMQVGPHGAFFDDDGYVRLFSMRFNDGAIGNFKLLPKNQTADSVLRFVKKQLVPWGLKIWGEEIFTEDDNTMIDDLARWLFKEFGSIAIDNLFEQYSIAHSAYFEITSGELVIAHPVRLRLG